MTAVRAIVVIGLSLYFLAVVGPPMFQNYPSSYSGVNYKSASYFQHTVKIGVDRGSPAYRAGLRDGATIGCLSPIDYEMLFPPIWAGAFVNGHRIALCVQHPGKAWEHISFAPKRMPTPGLDYGSPLGAALRACVYALFLFVGCTLVILRPSLMTWLLFGYCLASCPTNDALTTLVTLPPWLYALIALPVVFWSGLGTPVLALFSLTIPAETPPPGWRRALFGLTLVITLLTAAYVIAWPSFSIVGLGEAPIDAAITLFTAAIVIARLFTMERRERARFGWAAFAIIFGVAANAGRSDIPSNTVSVACGFLTVVMPLCLMYAILRRHVIDVRFVLSRTVVYALITTLVVGLIGVVDWATSVYLHQARAAMAVDALVTIALGFALHRAYGWIDHLVDFLIFREKHAAEEYLARLARTLPFAKSEATIDEALVSAPCEKFSLVAAALYRERAGLFAPACAHGWNAGELPVLDGDEDVVRFLLAERARLSVDELHHRLGARRFGDAAPALAVPIFQSNDLTGFALYAMHRDGTKLDPDEERELERLCERAAQAYTAIELARYRGTAPSIMPAMETL